MLAAIVAAIFRCKDSLKLYNSKILCIFASSNSYSNQITIQNVV